MHIVIVTGLSGAGKSTALRALEDIEFFCVDNIPMPLVAGMVDHLAQEGDRDKLAIAIDSRQRRNLGAWDGALAKLRGGGHRVEVMFLDASDEVLLRRFSETRRRHPLSGDDLTDGVQRDRELMFEMRPGASVIDTSHLNMHQLKSIIQERYGGTGKLAVTLLSFGFKHGLHVEHVVELDGRDPAVAAYVLGPDGLELVRQIESILRFSLPQFQKEGKLYVTICVGCTGGKHRSVAIVEELRRRLCTSWDILVRHRDVERGQ